MLDRMAFSSRLNDSSNIDGVSLNKKVTRSIAFGSFFGLHREKNVLMKSETNLLGQSLKGSRLTGLLINL